jgi:hypothetical protein
MDPGLRRDDDERAVEAPLIPGKIATKKKAAPKDGLKF